MIETNKSVFEKKLIDLQDVSNDEDIIRRAGWLVGGYEFNGVYHFQNHIIYGLAFPESKNKYFGVTGSSEEERLNQHISSLKNEDEYHSNHFLQEEFDSMGGYINPEIETCQYLSCSRELARINEQLLIQQERPRIRKSGGEVYNIMGCKNFNPKGMVKLLHKYSDCIKQLLYIILNYKKTITELKKTIDELEN